jgi:excisionase family DNA binding protein
MAGGAMIRSVIDLTPFCCSPKEAAKLTNLSVDVIYNAIKANELPAFEMVVNNKRVNRRLLKLVDLLDWINDYSVAFGGTRVGDKVEGVEPRDRVHEPTT